MQLRSGVGSEWGKEENSLLGPQPEGPGREGPADSRACSQQGVCQRLCEGPAPVHWCHVTVCNLSLTPNLRENVLQPVGTDGKELLWEIRERVCPHWRQVSQGRAVSPPEDDSALLRVRDSRPEDDRSLGGQGGWRTTPRTHWLHA